MVAAPVADGRSIFAVDATGEVTAVDAASGRRHWRFDTTPDKESGIALGAGLGLADGVLFCVTAAAEALALDPASGSVKWRVALPAPARGAPTIASGRLLVPTIENQLVALKTADGERLWTYKATPIATMALGLPAPAVEGDTIIAGFASGEVAAISAASGRALWSEALGVARGSSLADIAGVSGLPVAVGPMSPPRAARQ
jgi:outer membrane protein assembly factor BamB